MTQQSVVPEGMPTPTGPYSPALVWDNLVFLSGQEPRKLETGEVVEGDIRAHTRQTLSNIEVLLEAAGSSKEKILKVHIFLANEDDYAGLNEVYKEFFKDCVFPARRTTLSRLLGGISLEIDVIAYR